MTQEETNITNSNTKRLSVQISLNGLSFLIASETGVPLRFKESTFTHSTTPEEILLELQFFFSENNIWDLEFSEVTLVYSTDLFSLVPAAFFDHSKASEYLKFNSKILETDYIAVDTVDAEQAKVVYVPFININNLFFEKYGSFSYYHATTILLKAIRNRVISDLPQVFLHVNTNFFECIVYKHDRLLLCNSYPFYTPEDFVYYTLFAMEQLELDPETVPVHLSGNTTKDDALYAILYRYIRHLNFFEAEMHFDQLLPDAQNHHHFLIKNV